MSKNPATKASKRDRPRSGDKLNRKKNQIGTPEKSGTPSQDAAEENQSPSRNIIWNEEIEKLQIKEEDLKNIRETTPVPPIQSPKTSRVTVKKMKPASEWDRPKPKIVTVAKPAPPNAPVKQPDYSGFAGPRYNDEGGVIPHSLLGSFDDFRKEAIKRGDLLDIPDTGLDVQPIAPTLKYEKKKRIRKPGSHANECNALHNWQMKMMERKRQQGYISRLLQKNPEDLAMNAADNYRKIQEERYLIDRSIPAYDYGKGYRVGSEFWKQQERFGDDETGIHMTLTQAERGYPPSVEHVGIPTAIRQEKGWQWPPYHNTAVHYPWHKNPYLDERKKELQKAINDLDPHKPDFTNLQVVGISREKDFEGLEIIGTANPLVKERVESNIGFIKEEEGDKFSDINDQELDQLKENQDDTPEQIFGPSINFAGQPARWTGDSSSFNDQIGIEARVTFEAYSGDRVTSYLYIVNDGTTAVYYDWKKLPKENPFDLVHANVHRFYFNNSSGVILPGETMKFPFVFKSPNAGVFNEQWKFETRPTLCGGAALIVTLRGIALQEDKFQKEREDLERDLQEKQASQVVRQIMYDIISGIKTPDRPSSPVDAYIMDEEIFSRNNPKLFFNHEAVQELKQLYTEIAPEEERAGRYWDLSVEDLKDEILQMDEDDERKENFLHQLNTVVSKLSFYPQQPIKKNLYKVGYELLVEAVDRMVRESTTLRQVMGLPEKDTDDLPDDINNNLCGSTLTEFATESSSNVLEAEIISDLSPVVPVSKTPINLMNSSKSESRLSSRKQSSRLSREESDMRPASIKRTWRRASIMVGSLPGSPPMSSRRQRGDSRSKKADKAKAAPEKKAPPPKDAKAAKGKEAAKPDPKAKAPPAAKKPASSRGPSVTPGPPAFPLDRERTHTPTSQPVSPLPGDGDPVIERKYRQKMLSQAYIIMGDTFDKMGQVFDEVSYNEDRPPLAL